MRLSLRFCPFLITRQVNSFLVVGSYLATVLPFPFPFGVILRSTLRLGLCFPFSLATIRMIFRILVSFRCPTIRRIGTVPCRDFVHSEFTKLGWRALSAPDFATPELDYGSNSQKENALSLRPDLDSSACSCVLSSSNFVAWSSLELPDRVEASAARVAVR